MNESVVDNLAWADAGPALSVLIPFFRDDPSRLLAALDREAAELAGAVEVVVLDDGTGDDFLAGRVDAAVTAIALPARFVRLACNAGRAKCRNRLAAHARGGTFLFLDSDVLPDRAHFLAIYMELVHTRTPAVAFGGFSLNQALPDREHALHRALALKSDCAPAAVRRLAPEKHVFTSNLLVRRDVFETEAFDEGFAGWGWEDVEWAIRVSRRHDILHLDNTVTRRLDLADTIAAKYEQAVVNFARVVTSYREIVSHYPSYRAARMLKRMPLRWAWRPLLKAIALADPAPLSLRAFAMRLYRAAPMQRPYDGRGESL
jgi:glycosyltransferase involved in cell wall biosynthesis